jgi:hypothetical protein
MLVRFVSDVCILMLSLWESTFWRSAMWRPTKERMYASPDGSWEQNGDRETGGLSSGALALVTDDSEQGDQIEWIFAQWLMVSFGQLLENSDVAYNLWLLYSTVKFMHSFRKIMGLATFWAIFSQTHLFTLMLSYVNSSTDILPTSYNKLHYYLF